MRKTSTKHAICGMLHAEEVNGDGYNDVIIGAHGKSNSQGAVYVIYGGEKSAMTNIDFSVSGSSLNPQTTGFMITGSAADRSFGWSINSAGDINKDGYNDIIIGAPQKNNKQGAVYVVYGESALTRSNIDLSLNALDPLTTGFMITGHSADDYFGVSVSAGDVNGDGFDDVIIGAETKDSLKGAVYVIYGGKKSKMSDISLSSIILDPLTTGFSILGTASSGRAGTSVSAGDLNHDGYSDLILGAYGENTNTGAAYLVFSKCSPHCTACSSPSICTACVQGYVVENSQCKACPKNCDTCTDSKSCVVCQAPYLLYSRNCWDACPSETYPRDTENCDACPQGCSSCTSPTNCQTCISGYTLTKSNLCEVKIQIETPKVEEKDSEKAAAGVFEGSSLAGAALGAGSSLPLNFGLVAKIVRNFKYMKLPVSQELYETFVSWKVASGFMSAPKSWRLKYDSKTIPVVFSRYALQSAFLINFWKPMSMALIGIAVFGIFKVIEISVNNKKSIVSTISKQVHIAASNFALTQFYSNLDDVIFYFIIEMRSTEFETGFRVGSSLLAIVLLVVGAFFIVLHLMLIGKYQKLKEIGSSKEFEASFENISLIFKDFKDTNSLIQSFLMINVIRSITASLIFATLFEYPMIQISFLFVLNILMIVYIWKKKSFKEFMNTCGQLFCEGVLFIANICVFILALFDHTESYPISTIKGLGKCIIILNYILLFGCAILLLFSLGKSLYQSYLDRNKPQAQVQQLSLSAEKKKIFSSAKFNRPEESRFDQSISTNSGLVNESQDNSRLNSLYQNNAPALRSASENHEKLEKDPKMNYQEGNHHSNSIRNRSRKQNPVEGFQKSNSSNVALQSNKTKDFGEETNQASLFSNVLPRSHLVRNREITKARIAQFSENSEYGSPDSRIQDLSFHSGMNSNQNYAAGNQDISLTSFEMGIESPPRRGNDFISRRRTHANNGETIVGRIKK